MTRPGTTRTTPLSVSALGGFAEGYSVAHVQPVSVLRPVTAVGILDNLATLTWRQGGHARGESPGPRGGRPASKVSKEEGGSPSKP